jgi:tetratricopeptide (TPR) repeat protein
VESIEERRWTDQADRWIDIVSGVLPEIRAAHAWAQDRGEWRLAGRMTAGLGTYWHRDGHHLEGQRWVDQALGHIDEFDGATAGRLMLSAAFTTWPYADPARTRTLWQAAADRFRAQGDRRYLAYALGLLPGSYIGDEEHYDLAIGLCEESLTLAREVGDRPLIAQTLNVLGELARVHGDDDLALAAYTEGKDLVTEVHDDAHLSVFLANLAYLADHRGDYAEARRLGMEALRLCWSLGRRMMAAWTVSELAGPYLGLGRPERGALLVGAANQALEVLGVSRHPGDLNEYDRVMHGLRERLGDDEFEQLYAEGARMSLRGAVALALADADVEPRSRADSAAPR